MTAGHEVTRGPLPQWKENGLLALGVVVVVFMPISLLYLAPIAQAGQELPFVLALGCMLIVGWIFGRAADWFFGLPPLLGYMAFGFVFRSIQGPYLQAARASLLKLAFIVVLIRAGLEISPKDLNAFTVALSVLPFVADALASSCTAYSIYGLTGLEAATFASIMSSLGEGIVIPRMVDMVRRASPGHTLLPRAVLTAAPVECILALFMFGACSSMLAGQPSENQPNLRPLSGGEQAGLVLLQIICTLLVAALIAHSFALLLGARKRIKWRGSGKHFFIGSTHEELIAVIAMGMIAYGVSLVVPVPDSLSVTKRAAMAEAGGHRLLAEAAAAAGGHFESLVEADLCVVSTVYIFARLRPVHTVHRVEQGVSGVWTVAAIFLFTSLGSNLSLPATGNPLALLAPVAAGLCARVVAISLVMACSTHMRGLSFNLKNCFYESAFVLFATFPRATIQGVLGRLPLQNKLVSPEIGLLYIQTAALTVLVMAPLGVVLQSAFCERLLHRTDIADVHVAASEAHAAAHPPLSRHSTRPHANANAPAHSAAPSAAPSSALGRALKRAGAVVLGPNYLTTADEPAPSGSAPPPTARLRSGQYTGTEEHHTRMDGPAFAAAPGGSFTLGPRQPSHGGRDMEQGMEHTPPAMSRGFSHVSHTSRDALGNGTELGEHGDERRTASSFDDDDDAAAKAGSLSTEGIALVHDSHPHVHPALAHASEPLSVAEDAELARIASLYSHAPTLPPLEPLSEVEHDNSDDEHAEHGRRHI
ncbi:hypothetical protein T492DRAFT_1098259 [Pavlovales sp. CCMP2436]|nr:hypothetical protein T492DRAFT_1098259 [Pavlovales sp. CCMP2436]